MFCLKNQCASNWYINKTGDVSVSISIVCTAKTSSSKKFREKTNISVSNKHVRPAVLTFFVSSLSCLTCRTRHPSSQSTNHLVKRLTSTTQLSL